MGCISDNDIKLGFQFISDTYQRIADGRAEITRLFDEIEGRVSKIEKVMGSIREQNA